MKLNDQLAQHYYTAAEARKKLGLDESSFQYWGREKRITRKYIPGRKQPVYLKSEIDDIVLQIETALGHSNAETSREDSTKNTVHNSTSVSSNHVRQRYALVPVKDEEEIRETVSIAQQRFGEKTTSLETRIERFRKSPQGDYVLKRGNSIVGFFSMQAIKQDAISDLFKRKTGRWLTLDDIEPIATGKSLHLLISSIASRIDDNKRLEAEYGQQLVLKAMQLFVELGREGIEIADVWAMSSTVYGIKLCKDILKFKELGYINSEQIGFMMNVQDSEALIARQYLLAFKEYASSKGDAHS